MSDKSVQRPIYLDFQATTPTDERVVAAMMPFFTQSFGNPHSAQHAYGWEAEEAVEAARSEVAALIGAEPREIIFTSGATESNNLAIKGAGRFWRERKPNLITLVSEHKCVLESFKRLEREGSRVTYLPIKANGMVDLDQLDEALDEETALVSIMAANNEIGVLQPLAEIGALCRQYGAYFHSDAAQAAGKIPLDVTGQSIDLLSISGHKVYGPMGIGALYVRRRPRVRLEPLFDGGGQERGLRSGTLPAPLCVGLGEACRIARLEMAEEAQRLEALRRRLWQGLSSGLDNVLLNGDEEERLPGNLNVSFTGVDGEALIPALSGLALSTGSACTSAAVEPSYVLRALGRDAETAGASLRIGLGRGSQESDIDAAIEQIVSAVRALQAKKSEAAE